MFKTDALHHLKLVKEQAPRVHCLTNMVVQNLTANMLLSVNAQPSMSADISEVEAFSRSANALLINLGTMDSPRKAATIAAIKVANENNIPWILDPVLINRAPARLEFARELLKLHPAVIRGNAGEIYILADSAEQLAQQTGAVVACTGEKDIITNGKQSTAIKTGHPLMAHVTGMGCSGTAILAAFIAVCDDTYRATCAALYLFGHCGVEAANKVSGPGSFEAAILDELYQASQGAN